METMAVHSCKTGRVEVRERTPEEQAQVVAQRQKVARTEPSIREKLERATGLTIEQIKAELSR